MTYQGSPIGYNDRPKAMPLVFAPSVVLAGASYGSGGVPQLSDLAFIFILIGCLVLTLNELRVFARRFGVGGLTLFVGVVIWFCYDYLENWMGMNFDNSPHSAETVAFAVFAHALFVFGMAVGLVLPVHRKVGKLWQIIPEPRNDNIYFALIIGLFLFGMSPYVLFSRGNPLENIWNSIWAGRGGGGARWAVGRTGNLNYSWGGYVAQILEVGQIAGVFAVCYALIVAKSTFRKVVAWSFWLLQTALAFGTGTRTNLVIVGLPPIMILMIKYHAQAALVFQRISKKAYLVVAIIAFAFFVMSQIHTHTREQSFRNLSVDDINLTNVGGNPMFSESLAGFKMIPHRGFFMDSFPGHGLVMALPDTFWRFAIHPIPRALWHNKPVDPLWEWYNRVTVGTTGISGTTVSKGLVGSWFFRYGWGGMLIGAIFFGWLLRFCEYGLQYAEGRFLQIMLSMAFLAALFLMYRDMEPQLFWKFGVSVILIWFIMQFYKLASGAAAMAPAVRTNANSQRT